MSKLTQIADAFRQANPQYAKYTILATFLADEKAEVVGHRIRIVSKSSDTLKQIDVKY